MFSLLNDYANKAILTIDIITNVVSSVCQKYDINAVYLFGSYAKNKARSDSDIDLMIVSRVKGIEYYQLVKELETTIQNVKLMNEILKDGIKIYG